MRVLVAEDDSVSALVLRRALERLSHEVVATSDWLEAWEAYQLERFPIVVSDWMMPRMDGLGLCQRIRSAGAQSYTYVILLTAKTQREDRLRALDAGVDDFLTKPPDQTELAARIHVAQRIVESERQLREVNESLIASSQAMAAQAAEMDRMRREAEHLAKHDALTGLLSRRAWFEAATSGRPSALAIFDIDHFKVVNDLYGHPAGDRVLRQVAARLTEAIEPVGVVGRIGGEEFGALFELAFASAESVCRRAVGAVADFPMELPGLPPIEVTVSAGLSRWLPGRLTREESLARTYEAADRALYEAKNVGRHRLVVHGDRAAA